MSTSTKLPRERTAGRSMLVWIAARIASGLMVSAAVIAVLVGIGVAQRWGWFGDVAAPVGNAAVTSGGSYTCPMHPQIRQPGAGRCPICGMALVPAASTTANLDALSVRIEPAQRRLAHIQTAKVESTTLEETLRTVGSIAIDESRQATIAAYVDGRIERLFADYTGVEIKKGDHLAVVYSPQLFGAQVEYVEASRVVASGLPAVRQAQETLVANARRRLRELGMTDEQLVELDKSSKPQSRLTIYSPQGGTVVEKLVVEGNYVKAGDPIYRVAELSTVWLTLRLFPEDATRVRFGQHVEAVVQSIPDKSYLGRVAFVDPTVDVKTRTVGVRVELVNDGRLRPGDYADAAIRVPIGPQGTVYDANLAGKWISPMHPQIIRDSPGECPICGMELVPTARYGFTDKPVEQPPSLHVPRSAVLMAGENSVVYVETKPGLFEIRPITVGRILRDRVVVLGGLKVDEEVATSGNFLIDSQMQLAGKPSLVDVARVREQTAEQEGPLVLDQLKVEILPGEAGMTLERLFSAYFDVHQVLAADRKPPANSVESLNAAAGKLVNSPGLPPAVVELAKEVAAHSEHLHHLDLKKARGEFRVVSQAVVKLAAQARGADSSVPFTHFYCSMVPGGGGDWLQPNGDLLNPFFGSQMLRCGEQVRVFAVPTTVTPPPDATKQPVPSSSEKAGNQ